MICGYRDLQIQIFTWSEYWHWHLGGIIPLLPRGQSLRSRRFFTSTRIACAVFHVACVVAPIACLGFITQGIWHAILIVMVLHLVLANWVVDPAMANGPVNQTRKDHDAAHG